MQRKSDVIVIGAGAAGMMCAIRAAQRGRSVIVLDHAKSPGEKIRISGGGRCNFTNIHAGPAFLSYGFSMSTDHAFLARVRAAGQAARRHRNRMMELKAIGSAGAIVFAGLLLAVVYCLMTHRLVA